MVKKKSENREFVKIVKASEKGLDYLHFSLIFLVILLIAFVLFLAKNQKISISQQPQPLHSQQQVENFSSILIASYLGTNYSFIPFSSSLPKATFFNGTWIVEANVSKDKLLIFIDDKNLTIKDIFFSSQIPKLSPKTNLKLVANGVIELSYAKCNQSYWFIDPYSINALTTLNYSTPQIKFIFIFTKDSLLNYPTYGVNRTQLFVKYLYCAYKQQKLINFVEALKNLGIIISPRAFPVHEEVLKQASFLASLDQSQLNSCLNSSAQALNAQAILANYYNITFSPAVLIDCKYLTIPQHISDAIAYSKS